MRDAARALWIVIWCGLTLGLSGCPSGGGGADLLSPGADVRITNVATPGGTALAPVVSAAAAGATTTAASVEFPQAAVDVTVFNGVSASLTAYSVTYTQEDGVTPLGPAPFRGFLSEFIQAKLKDNGFDPTTVTVHLSLVSDELRSLLAGVDGRLGTDDDLRSTVVGVLTIGGTDINGHDVRATSRVSITARPQSP